MKNKFHSIFVIMLIANKFDLDSIYWFYELSCPRSRALLLNFINCEHPRSRVVLCLMIYEMFARDQGLIMSVWWDWILDLIVIYYCGGLYCCIDDYSKLCWPVAMWCTIWWEITQIMAQFSCPQLGWKNVGRYKICVGLVEHDFQSLHQSFGVVLVFWRSFGLLWTALLRSIL